MISSFSTSSTPDGESVSPGARVARPHDGKCDFCSGHDLSIDDTRHILDALDESAYLALKESIRQHGVKQPVIADEFNRVWDGRARVRACRELGLSVPVKRIQAKDGPLLTLELLKGRQWTLLDYVSFITWIEREGLRCNPLADDHGELTGRISRWLKDKMGWTDHNCPRYIRHLRCLRRYLTQATEAQMKEVRKMRSPATAVSYFKKAVRGARNEHQEIRKTITAMSKAANKVLLCIGDLGRYSGLAEADKEVLLKASENARMLTEGLRLFELN